MQTCQVVVHKEEIFGGYKENAFGNNINPTAWQPNRIKRFVNSTLAAEAMSLIEASRKAYWIRCIIIEIFSTIATPVICLTDSKTLYHAAKSSK